MRAYSIDGPFSYVRLPAHIFLIFVYSHIVVKDGAITGYTSREPEHELWTCKTRAVPEIGLHIGPQHAVALGQHRDQGLL